MSSSAETMVQRLVNIVLQGAGIVAPATSTTSVLNIETEIPQGIPALFEYSRLHKKMSVLDKLAAKLSLGRQFAQKPEVRLAAAACGLLYVSRSRIVPILSSIGDEMNGELLDWFDPSRTTATLTATELRQMSDDADDTEKRIDYLETQLAKAQNALEVEKTGHEETKRDLHRQTTSRANVEVELESLRAELEPGKSAEDDNPELKTIEEAEEESEAASLPEQGHAQADPTAGDAQVERLQKQLEAEQTNYRFVFKKKEVFRQGGLKLKNELEKLKADYQKLEDGTEIKKDLDKLQADFNVLEDSRDTWQEKYEALEQQAGVQVLETSSEELDKEDETETTNEAEDEEPIDWKAAYERLQIEFADLNERHDQLNAERAGTAEHTDESQQQSQKIEFDPLYDISDHGDDEGDDRDGSEGHEENQGHEDDTPAQSLPPPTPTILNAMAAAFTPAAVASRVDTPESSAMIPAESLISSSMNAGEPLSPHPPAPKATGSGHVRNAHVRAVNEDVMRKSWRRNSGMPDRDEEVVLAPEDRMEIEGMFQRQIIQAYTPVLAFSTFPPSFTDILDAPEMRRARRTLSPGSSQAREDLPRAAPITPSPSVGDSGDRGADTDDESEGEWSDEDDSDDSDDNAPDSMPMLGNYRVTRPESSGDDAEVLMLGDHQVTRAPTPAEGDSEEPKVAHGQAPAGSESVMLAREEEAADDKSSVKVGEEGGAAGEVGAEDKEKDAEEDEKLDEEEDEEEVGSENEPKPSSPCSSPRKAPQAVRPTSDGSNPDFPPGQLPRRPSNFFPNEANAPITYNEKMSALMAEELSKIATLKLSESMWAPKPDEKSQVMSQKASSSSSSTPPAEHKTPPRMSNVGTSQADQAPPHGQEQLPRRPSNLFPDEANAPITHNEKMSVLIADGLSKVATIPLSASIWATKPEEKSQVMPQAAPSSSSAPPADHRTSARMLSVGSSQADQAPPRGPSISNDGPKPQPPPDAPTGPRGHLARDSVQGGLQQNQGANSQTSPLGRQPNVAPPQGAANRNDNWSPRGNARRGYQPGQPRRNWAPEPPRTPPAAAGNDTNTNTQYPPAGRRGGRGGRGTPPPASGPPRTPAPNTPRAAPAAIFGDNTPPAGPAGRRGGRGGRGQAAPQAGPARGGRSAAMESFARQNLGKKEG